jgi:hypothetical protein
MSNEAYLIATDTPGPVGIDFETHVGYDPDGSEVVANAPHAVPVFWLALFDASNILTLDVAGENEDVTVPSLVAEMAVARRLLEGRRSLVLETFPEFGPTWDRFTKLLDRLEARFLKVELQELWDMEPDEFKERLEASLRWFDTRSDDDFAPLLEMVSITGYDEARRTYPSVGEGVPRAFHMRGYASKDSDWDDKSDVD